MRAAKFKNLSRKTLKYQSPTKISWKALWPLSKTASRTQLLDGRLSPRCSDLFPCLLVITISPPTSWALIPSLGRNFLMFLLVLWRFAVLPPVFREVFYLTNSRPKATRPTQTLPSQVQLSPGHSSSWHAFAPTISGSPWAVPLASTSSARTFGAQILLWFQTAVLETS